MFRRGGLFSGFFARSFRLGSCLFGFAGVSRSFTVGLRLGRLFLRGLFGRSFFRRGFVGLGFFPGSHTLFLRSLFRSGSFLRRPGRQVAFHAAAANQLPHALGGLRALPQPVIDPIQGQLQGLLTAGRYGIVETQPLDEPAVALVAPVGNDDVVKGPFLGPVTG